MLRDRRYDPRHTTFFLPCDEVIKEHAHGSMTRWRAALFGQMAFHSTPSAKYYGLRAEDVVELGIQVAL
jgi:KUP system potassium uptake protein